jgi:hypothetical protein
LYPNKPEKLDKEKKEKDKKEKKQKEEKPFLLIAEVDQEGETKRIDDEKYQPFKRVSFTNTNPLQIWGQKRVRLVRIGYELIKNKSKSTSDKDVYDLYRKETTELKNKKFKEEEIELFRKKPTKYEEDHTVRTHIIAADIKEMFVQYIAIKPKKAEKTEGIKIEVIKDESLLTEEDKFIKSFSWGDTEQTKNIFPIKVSVTITFWKTKQEKSRTFKCLIPILSYNKIAPPKKDKPNKEDPKKDEKK